MCRYIIFYSPFDVGYKFFKFLPIKVICAALKEIYRRVPFPDRATGYITLQGEEGP
jgi:hypothetical protein